MKTKPIGLYLHIPFCVKKCNYCDFCSYPSLSPSMRREYISQLVKEIKGYKREEKITVDTVFFGGGTPSLLSTEEFFEICDAIDETFEITEDAEFTVEANPKTVNPEKLSAYISRGVNRISLGLQTIHENELKKLGRIHDFDDFVDAYNLVSDSGITNISIDIMYGIPEQTLDSFRDTLLAALSLSPAHISVYGLILEENTPFWENRKNLRFPSEDEECDMYYFASSLLAERGYSHYEISNYAKPGYRSRHNMKYWKLDDFIGVGVTAYSFFEGVRYGNLCDIAEYISSNLEQYIKEDKLDASDLAFEYVMLGLRTSDGISADEYKRLFGADFLSEKKEKIDVYVKNGYMTVSGDRIALTEKGFYVSNSILVDLL